MSSGLFTTTYYSLLRHQDVKRPTNYLLLTRCYVLLRHQYVKQHRQRLEQRHHQDAQALDPGGVRVRVRLRIRVRIRVRTRGYD